MRRTASSHLYADKAEIGKCDMMAGNGVVMQVEDGEDGCEGVDG